MKRIIFDCLLAVLILAGCSRSTQNSQERYSPADYDARIGVWYNYSNVDWASLDTLYYRPYNCDWPEAYVAAEGADHLSEVDARVWHLLQNARTKFHQDNLPLRSAGDSAQCAALDAVESSFDTVFVHFMRGDYYLRAFVDAYQEVMPAAIDML